MKRSEKEQIVAESQVAGRASRMFFTDFNGLTVEQAAGASRVQEVGRAVSVRRIRSSVRLLKT
jgi:hypothetical protein